MKITILATLLMVLAYFPVLYGVVTSAFSPPHRKESGCGPRYRKEKQLERMTNAKGFIAALDQNGGSTPKALALYTTAEA